MLRRLFPSAFRCSSCYAHAEATRSSENALLGFIRDKIRSTGPIPVHEFQKLVSGSQVGYYAQRNTIFGSSGDFVTAPELSQVFGEIVGLFVLNELKFTGHQGEYQLIEMGPGTGKLMSDILRVFQRFKVGLIDLLDDFKETKMSVHLVDISENLIDEQEMLLCGVSSNPKKDTPWVRENRTIHGFPIFWYRRLEDIPKNFSVFVANEFLDAMPIHQFKRGQNGLWHEVYVNLNSENKLVFMLSKGENLFTTSLLPDHIRNDPNRIEWEVCPDACMIITEVCERILFDGGFGLFIDYGHDGTRPNFSMRAYKKHEVVHPLDTVGENDITSDVDFGYLKSLISDRALVFGPVEQRRFLEELGISLRMRYLLKQCKTEDEQESLMNGFKMLMDPSDGMGSKFKPLYCKINGLIGDTDVVAHSQSLYAFLILLREMLTVDSIDTQQAHIIITPIRYDLQIQLPTSSRKDPLIPSFFGSVKIDFLVTRSILAPSHARRYQFHAFMPQFRHLPFRPIDGVHLRLLAQKLENFENVTLYGHSNARTVRINSIKTEPKHVVFVLGESTLPQGRYTLNIERYTGIITYDKGIFYRDAGQHPVLGTDLFPYYAPLVLPIVEDAGLKAKFQVGLIHPHNTIALSSTHALDSTQPLNENWKFTKFAQSDNLSAYNLFIGVLPSEYERAKAMFPIYVWTNKHLHPKTVKETMTSLVEKVYDEIVKVLKEPLPVSELNFVMMNDFNGTQHHKITTLGTHSFGTVLISLEEFMFADDTHQTAMVSRALIKQWIGGVATISSLSELCFQEDLVEFLVNKILAALYTDASVEYQKYRLASYVRVQVAETFFAPGESLTLVDEPDELSIRTHCGLKGAFMLESLEDVMGPSLINKIQKLVSDHKHDSFHLSDFLVYLKENIADKNISLSQIYGFWQMNGGIPNVYVEKMGENLRLIQLNHGRKAQVGADTWSPMPLWPLHVGVENLTLPVTFMISQGLELAPIDNKTLVLTNLGYKNVYRVNYDPVTWQDVAQSLADTSRSFSAIEKAQLVNDFCYFHSLGETGQEGNKIRRSFMESIRHRNEEYDLCDFYSFWCSAGKGKKINLGQEAKQSYRRLVTKIRRVLSNRKHYACLEAPPNSGGDTNASKVANELCHLAFGSDCI